MTIPAYLYVRWSTADQAKGHSLERQREAGKAYIEQMGWLYSPEREIIDDGLSAFHGNNREEGSSLHEFEQKAKAGHFNNGVVLAVENLDRLTRQGWQQAVDLVTDLTSNGVSVAIWQSHELLEAGERLDMSRVIRLITRAELAYEESEKKSKRLKAAWQTKRENASQGDSKALTRMVPGWLEVNETTGRIEPIPHRAEVLNWIYDSYVDGKGLPWIERELNARKEPNWGRGKHGNKGWNVSTLHKYLTTRTVLGEYEPKIRTGKHDKASTGGVIPNYYPQVISPDKFNRVQAIRKERSGWGGKSTNNLPNLFSGIARCSDCDAKLHMTGQSKVGTLVRNKNKNGTYREHRIKEPRSYLTCNNARRCHGCTNKTRIRYERLEAGVLRSCWELAMRGEVIKPSQAAAHLQASIAEHERLLGVKRNQLDTLMDNLMSVHSKALAQKAAELETLIEQDEAQLEDLRRQLEIERGKAPPKVDLDALTDARSALQSDDPAIRYAARVKTHQALRGLIRAMECRPDGSTAIVIGDYAVGMTFDSEGTCTDVSVLPNARIYGPDGEKDWHPDEAA